MSGGKDNGGFLDNWLRSGLAGLLVALALGGGVIALVFTPREEEPQIDVPLMDIFVKAPGLSAAEVERRITWPMEQTLFGTEGVEYVYSRSFPDGAILTARFYVGVSPTESEVRVRNRLARNRHRYSSEMTGYQIRPVYVDDVPFMTVTLHSDRVDDAGLLSLAEEYLVELTSIEGVGLVSIQGGRNEEAYIELDPQKMAAHGAGLKALQEAVAQSNFRLSAGRLVSENEGTPIRLQSGLGKLSELRNLVVASEAGRPVFLRDVAEVTWELPDPKSYIAYAEGPASTHDAGSKAVDPFARGAVTLALAKRSGANAVFVSAAVRDRLDHLRTYFESEEVGIAITRDYGQGADDAVNWLTYSLLGASGLVIAVLAAALGLKEALIVAVSIPTTFSIALLVNYLAGFSLNRVTLFALIVALGLIVDDSIVSIDNIHRYLNTSAGKGLHGLSRVAAAVREVLPPMLLTSLVVVAAFVPLAFVTGLMGPYMAPMALTVPVAMMASTAVATLAVPWLAQLLLAGKGKPDGTEARRDGAERPAKEANSSGDATEDTEEAKSTKQVETDEVYQTARYRWYSKIVEPLLERRILGFGLIGVLLLLFVFSAAIPLMQWIPLKLLPYDDAEEMQLVVDQKEGATLEETTALLGELAEVVLRQREVLDMTAYAGIASPVGFNGLVRGYYLREGPHLGDIRINLIDDDYRHHSSHQIALRIREKARPIAEKYQAVVKVVERPPGPPVLAPVVAEISGPPTMEGEELRRVAGQVVERFRATDGLVDVDTSLEHDARQLDFVVDREKAALTGVRPADLGALLAASVRGGNLSLMREARELRPRPVRVRLPDDMRDDPAGLLDLPIARVEGRLLTLGELGQFEAGVIEQNIDRKNLRQVVYVTADVAGRTPTEAVFELDAKILDDQSEGIIASDAEVRFDGEGEWFITRRVFRDLGIALGVAVLAIYAMLVYQTGGYWIGLILLTSVPLTIIGIMPGFWLLNLLLTEETAGYAVGVPFTATGMIGIVALAGIAVRNAILLIDFTQNMEKAGRDTRDALLRAGALRVRPILLTAGTAMLAVIPIAFDPVFSSLAWSLIFGLFVSTVFTLLLVPVLYSLIYDRGSESSPA
ncbi:MAG TPA: efflux RND transporter permease subunit [Opitutales bacterium]|nr:efflux RND transporter permease subunit [Opitutales bacterium]